MIDKSRVAGISVSADTEVVLDELKLKSENELLEQISTAQLTLFACEHALKTSHAVHPTRKLMRLLRPAIEALRRKEAKEVKPDYSASQFLDEYESEDEVPEKKVNSSDMSYEEISALYVKTTAEKMRVKRDNLVGMAKENEYDSL
mmetsp:Transcript_30409/g.29039  ORF Transcript_30409/g.29039 Transcript_30409/m.29039 type:complete len:146 (-) Transcript_30409:664-1101(-)